MKNKGLIIILITAFVLCLIGFTVYQAVCPPLPTPSKEYSTAKATLLLNDYSSLFEGEESTTPDGGDDEITVYGIMYETSMYDMAKELGYVAAFSFFDINGNYSYFRADGQGFACVTSEKIAAKCKKAVEFACGLDTAKMKKAGNTDYTVPPEGKHQVYIATSAGVYYLEFDKGDESFSPLLALHLDALKLLADLPTETAK